MAQIAEGYGNIFISEVLYEVTLSKNPSYYSSVESAHSGLRRLCQLMIIGGDMDGILTVLLIVIRITIPITEGTVTPEGTMTQTVTIDGFMTG